MGRGLLNPTLQGAVGGFSPSDVSRHAKKGKLWPTPMAADATQERTPEAHYRRQAEKKAANPNLGGLHKPLITAVLERQMWPTPTARDHKDGSYCPNVPVNGLLGRAVWPTPTTKANQGAPPMQARGQACRNLRAATNGGSLNPQWVEWLMGFPTGWTV